MPVHVGFIIDGNRRWAKQHGLPTYEGHLAGYNAMQEVLLETLRCGVKYASIYVFSTENWKRDEKEIAHLMNLILRAFKNDLHFMIDNNVRVKVVGSRDGLSDTIRKAIDGVEEKTRHLSGGELLICLNYGGYQEITDAVKKIIAAGREENAVTPELIASNLYAPEVPPCDVIVRTSGEQRLSNFMLWRAAYSEFIFLDKCWPDMTKQDVSAILEEYSRRNRRFGGN